MPIWGWIALGVTALLALSFLMVNRRQMKRRLSIEDYVIYLLLNDEVREDHKAKFVDWIEGVEANDAFALALHAHEVVDQMASRLAESGSILTASAMVWEAKARSRS